MFPYIAKNIEGSLYLSNFISGFYSQIWLNVLQDNYHFGNITNTKTKQHIQRVFVKRLALICKISNLKKEHLSDFFNSFQQVAKIQKDSLKKLHLYMVYSQIWLNLLVDIRQFGYITKLKTTHPKTKTQKKNTADNHVWSNFLAKLLFFFFQKRVTKFRHNFRPVILLDFNKNSFQILLLSVFKSRIRVYRIQLGRALIGLDSRIRGLASNWTQL